MKTTLNDGGMMCLKGSLNLTLRDWRSRVEDVK